MAKQPRNMEAFAQSLVEEYKVPDIASLVATDAYKKAFAESGGDPVEAAEMLNRKKTVNATIPAWFIRSRRVEDWDKKLNGGKGGYVDQGPGIEVILPNMRTRTYPFGGDTSTLKPLQPVKVAGVTELRKIHERSVDYVRLEDGKVVIEAHGEQLPPADPEWVFKDGSSGGDPGPLFKITKLGTVQGDTGDHPVFGVYTVVGDEEYSVTMRDGAMNRKQRPFVHAVVKTPSGRRLKAKFYDVEGLFRRFNLDESARASDWGEAMHGKQFCALGKIGLYHPKGPGDFEARGTPRGEWRVMKEAIEGKFDAAGNLLENGLRQHGCIKSEPIKSGPNTGKMFEKLDLSKMAVTKNDKGEDVRHTYVNIGKFRVYALEKRGDEEWSASVRAEEVGGLPWLSFTPGDEPKDENGKQYGASFFHIFMDDMPGQKKAVDANSIFAKAMAQQGLAKFA